MEKKWPNANQYKWQRSLTLTKSEGIIMDEILSHYNCPNISQFCKKNCTWCYSVTLTG